MQTQAIPKNQKGLLFFLAITAIWSALEILAYSRGGIFSTIASRIWLGWFGFYAFISFLIVIQTLVDDLRNRWFWGILALFFVTMIVGIDLPNLPINTSSEATLQVASGLNNFTKKDFGYTETAFLGNPARQYLLTALPSLFLGRSLVPLRLGYLIPFLFGVFIFYAGLRAYNLESGTNHRMASLAVLGSIAFPIVPVLLRSFEQIILPIAFTFQAVGWFFITFHQKKIQHFLALVWIGSLLATTYTPAVASWALLLVILSGICLAGIWNRWSTSALPFFFCLVALFSIGVTTLYHREDLRLLKIEEINNIKTAEIGEKITDTFLYFFMKDTTLYGYQVPFVGQLLFLPVLAYLVGAFLFIFGLPHVVVALWILATVAFAGISPGFARPPPAFGIHRAMVVIPIFLAALSLTKWKEAVAEKGFMSVLFIALCLFNTLHLWLLSGWSQKNIHPGSILLRETLATAKRSALDSSQPIYLYAATQDSRFRYFPDLLAYFFPKAAMATTCNELVTTMTSAIVFTDDQECVQMIGQRGDFQMVELWTYNNPSSNETTVLTKAVRIL